MLHASSPRFSDYTARAQPCAAGVILVRGPCALQTEALEGQARSETASDLEPSCYLGGRLVKSARCGARGKFSVLGQSTVGMQ